MQADKTLRVAVEAVPDRMRRLRRVLVAFVIVVTAAAAGWFVWLPQHHPTLREGEQYGIDVSHHQGRINWSLTAAADVAFAYIKATEGATHVDTQFARNWNAAQRVGIRRGAYHFFTLCTTGQEQADNFLRAVPHDRDSLPPAVDLELAGNCAARPEATVVHDQLDDFLNRVEAAIGHKVVLYVGPEFDQRYQVTQRLDRPLWKLSLLRRPDMNEVTIWQVMGSAKIDGIPGRVDLNVANLDVLTARSAASVKGPPWGVDSTNNSQPLVIPAHVGPKAMVAEAPASRRHVFDTDSAVALSSRSLANRIALLWDPYLRTDSCQGCDPRSISTSGRDPGSPTSRRSATDSQFADFG